MKDLKRHFVDKGMNNSEVKVAISSTVVLSLLLEFLNTFKVFKDAIKINKFIEAFLPLTFLYQFGRWGVEGGEDQWAIN